MALIKCHECGKDVSTEAAACQNCGAPPATSAPLPAKVEKVSNLMSVIVLSAVIIGLVAMCSSTDDQSNSKKEPDKCAKDDLQCLGDKAVVAAGIYCKDPIERLAKHSVRWTDGTFETKFSRFRWKDKAAGKLTMIGDRAEFQNGFGAYTPVIYECDLDADGKTVLEVRANEGRLPK